MPSTDIGAQEIYLQAVRSLAKHYNQSPELLAEEEVRRYLLDVRERNARGSFKTSHYGIQFFYRNTLGLDWALFKKIRLPKQRRLPQTLSHAEVRRILAAVRNPIHRGCFSLIYGCGLRISEAAALPVTAIDKTSGVLRVVGKGNKERVVPVAKEVHEGLRRMWQAKDHRGPRWLFPNGWRTGPVATHVLTRAPAESGDFYFVDAADAEEGVRKVLAIVRERIPKRFGLDPVRDIQVLCPMNRGGLGARSLNIELQNALNPPGEIRIERFGWTFCPGDKVMQVENDYDKEVYNGDLGVVSRIDMEEGELSVDFDGRDVNYGFGELDELVLAYATTIHKSQGSEYPAVVIPLTTQHYPMLQRNLVYTGVTRGKRLVVLVGQRKALAIAVKGSRAGRRWSKLREWLIGSGTPARRGSVVD